MLNVLLIIAGGGVGALLRYALGSFVQRGAGDGFPIGTIAVNVLGCLLIGVAGALIMARPEAAAAGWTAETTGDPGASVEMAGAAREAWRLALVVGLLGAFTTFSTFSWETLALVNANEWGRAALNVLLSNGLGLAAVWIGFRVARGLG